MPDADVPVLDYAAPAIPAWQALARSLRASGVRVGRAAAHAAARALRRAWRFASRRPLGDVETAAGAWVAWSLLYVFWTLRGFTIGDNLLKPALVVTWILPVLIAWMLARLVRRWRWRAIGGLALLFLATLPAAGMLQFDRCPHARYLSVFGRSYALEGKACGNPRNVAPWWLR